MDNQLKKEDLVKTTYGAKFLSILSFLWERKTSRKTENMFWKNVSFLMKCRSVYATLPS